MVGIATPSKQEILDYSVINKGEKEDVPRFKRFLFYELKKVIDKTKLNITITGLRRVGKTTLVKQLLNECSNAFYFSFDEPRYRNYETLKKVIETFISEREHPLIGLDEIGFIKDWAGLIKKYYDQGKARFILTGSSSLNISKGKESLAGRVYEVTVPPLQYHEFLELKYRVKPLRSFDEIFKEYRRKSFLSEFFVKGSFPEIVDFDSKLVKNYVNGLVDKVVFEDIPSVFNIKYREKLYHLLKYCAEYSCSLINEYSTAGVLGINKTTVSEYLFYLSKSFVVSLLYTEGSLAKKFRKMKKVYLSNASMYNALSENAGIGCSAETSVFDKLRNGLYFYRDAQKREVDFIYKGVPIEVKYSYSISKQDMKHILYYLKKKKKPYGIMLTKDYLDEVEKEDVKLYFIPLHLFLGLDEKGVDGLTEVVP